jgi:hypothetical protein
MSVREGGAKPRSAPPTHQGKDSVVFPGCEDRWHHGQPSMPQGDTQDIWHSAQRCQHDLLPPEHACGVPLLLQPQPLSGQWRFPEKVRGRCLALKLAHCVCSEPAFCSVFTLPLHKNLACGVLSASSKETRIRVYRCMYKSGCVCWCSAELRVDQTKQSQLVQKFLLFLSSLISSLLDVHNSCGFGVKGLLLYKIKTFWK